MDSFEGSVAYEELSFAGVRLHQLNTATGKVRGRDRGRRGYLLHLVSRVWPIAILTSNPPFNPQVFILSEIALEVFRESPTVFAKVSHR